MKHRGEDECEEGGGGGQPRSSSPWKPVLRAAKLVLGGFGFEVYESGIVFQCLGFPFWPIGSFCSSEF